MESFEFLGGWYNRPEQIMSGPVQAFKAQNAANGRIVFIHRVSTTEAPDEQSALLKLLTTALVKSSDAKRLVLDFGEDRGHWYVVTESEPQCALLREWLQTEIANALAGSKPIATVGTQTTTKPPAPTQPADPGEFTRFLQRPSVSSPVTSRIIDARQGDAKQGDAKQGEAKQTVPPAVPSTPTSPAAGEFSRLFQSQLGDRGSSAQPPAAQQPVVKPPGEFTSFFNTNDTERKNEPPPLGAGPAQNTEQKKEPGEFTRFFTPGLPTVPPKQTALPVMNFERTQNNPYVQRPNSPPPPPPPVKPSTPKQDEPGEFTRMFSAKPSEGGQLPQQRYDRTPDVRSDPMGFSQQPSNQFKEMADNLFNDKIDVGRPLPSSQPQQSEFTKVFGAVGAEAPLIAPPAVVSAQRDPSMLDDSHGTQQLPTMQQSPVSEQTPAGHTPSEFTMIMQGGYGQGKPSTGPSPATGAAASGAGASPIDLNIAPMGAAAMPYLGSASGSLAGVHGNVSQHGASVNSALGSAHMSGPKIPAADFQAPLPGKAAANKKLMLFFILLGVLTVLLIIVIMILMKSK